MQNISKKKHITAPPQFQSLDDATGTIDYRFTNDYMFRAILQENTEVLTALICSLLHLKRSDVTSVVITNPIILGEHIDDKDFILDIAILLNHNVSINLEMQVANYMNWEERSLCYLCRSFDRLHAGQDYIEANPAIQIGFLDFTLFPEHPEFYATYKLLNVKNHHLYSDKLTLSVVDLTQLDLATGEDKDWGIDYWAKLFKVTTWEELKMISKKNDALREASEALYIMNADQMIREQCRAREDYYRIQNTMNYKLEKVTAEKEELASENQNLSSKVEYLSSENKTLSSENETLSSENKTLSSKYEALSSEYKALASEIEELKELLLKQGISDKNK